MNTWNPQANDLFLQALELPPGGPRELFLGAKCSTNAELRTQVESLLRAGARANDFLEVPPETFASSIELPVIGAQIGPYKIRELIGEGGMGEVYVAEQQEPVRRKVALKIIRPGMATKQVVARFEAERQALALMDHPHIARIFDGGATDSGQPYFVMELVQGPPITEYCDEQRLSTRARLELFVNVCRAVQHAHQKGIIHRDLKPSNVLVPEIDGAAVPKVIDFGVAKAVEQPLTTGTVYTHFSQMVGTPLYMSPEQAGLGVIDIDTRSDVYSLGVLLYELLSGHTPFDSQTLKQAGFEEMQRIIREVEPSRPSALVNTLDAAALSTVAERRASDPRKLGESLRGELDWIVMRCLEKDRSRRYESASALADDLQRFLDGDPVEACPPSAVYRMRKFARRYRGVLALVANVLVALSIGLALAAWQAARATAMAERERLARVQAQKNLEVAISAVADMYQGLATNWMSEDAALSNVQQVYLRKAVDFYGRLLDDPNDYRLTDHQAAEMAWRSALMLRALGEPAPARARLSLGAARFSAELHGRESSASDASLELWADMFNLSGLFAFEDENLAQAKLDYEAADAVCELLAERPAATAAARIKQAYVANNLHLVHDAESQLELAETTLRRAIEILENLGRDTVAARGAIANDLGLKGNLCRLLVKQGNSAEGESIARQALEETRVRLLDAANDRMLREAEVYLLDCLAFALVNQQTYAEAEQVLEELVRRRVNLLSIQTEPPNYTFAELRQLSGGAKRLRGQVEPKKWSEWIRAAVLLAEVKLKLGQPVAAENLLSQAESTAKYLHSLSRKSLRHGLDRALVMADFATVLQERDAAAAERYAASAARTWRELLQNFPQLEHRPSELRPGTSDYLYFLKRFPEYDIRQPEVAQRVAEAASARSPSARDWVLAQIAAEDWQGAAQTLSHALDQTERPEAYDLLTLSYVLARLERWEEARTRYAAATPLLANLPSIEPIVAERRRQVETLLEANTKTVNGEQHSHQPPLTTAAEKENP